MASVACLVPPSSPVTAILDLPRDVLLALAECLGPASVHDAAPVCTELRALAAEKVMDWRKQRAVLCNISLTDFNFGSGLAMHPFESILHRYESMGVRFEGSTAGIVPGISDGDPSNWQLEGTVRDVTGGGRFIGFNTDGQHLKMHYRRPVSACTFDLLTRDPNCKVTIGAKARDGTALRYHQVSVGPARSTWMRKINSDSQRARAIETVHCTTVCLVPISTATGEQLATRIVESDMRTVLTLTLCPGEEMASVSIAFNDQTTHKDDEKAIGLANIRVSV